MPRAQARSGLLFFAAVLAFALTSCVPDVTRRRDSGPDAASSRCSEGQSRVGTAPCGLNGRGRLSQICRGGAWVDTASCSDHDECQDDTARGSCADDAGEICGTGEWIPGDCQGCAAVDCSSTGPTCCAGVVVFALDTGAANFRNRPDLVTSFAPGENGLVAGFSFDAAGQRGVIGFDLAAPMPIERVAVNAAHAGAAGSPYVTLDSARGANGCAYALFLGEIDVYAPMFCWGSFNFNTTTRINVRMDATAAAPATLSVQSVSIN